MAAHPEKVLEVLRENTWRLNFGQIKEACMRIARDPPNTELYSHTQSSLSMSRPLQVHLTPDSKSRRSDGVMLPLPIKQSTPNTARSWLEENESDRKGHRRRSRELNRQARAKVAPIPRAKKASKIVGRRRGSSSETTPLPIPNGRGAGGWALAGLGGGPGSGGPDYMERSSTNASSFT
mmetsp:Transcript_6840/g.13429  ORF Transcript_6840/g.13429 Transcript_6840/m.13429 type:complete len:179 (-) Transcript_6840:87-623(-)